MCMLSGYPYIMSLNLKHCYGLGSSLSICIRSSKREASFAFPEWNEGSHET